MIILPLLDYIVAFYNTVFFYKHSAGGLTDSFITVSLTVCFHYTAIKSYCPI